MHSPSARVTIERGTPSVKVYRENVVVEVRNYDTQPRTGYSRDAWTDRDGRKCRRYFVPSSGQQMLASEIATDLERFASDLGSALKMSASFGRDKSPDGLHVLTVDGVDFYFNADGSGYDGWGKRVDLDRGKK